MTPKQIKAKMRRILKQTIEYYGADISRRALGPNGCIYQTHDKRCCAVGRLLTQKQRDLIVEDANNGIDVHTLVEMYEFKNLNLPTMFYKDLQSFHDVDTNWSYSSDTGLSDDGKDYSQHILDYINNGAYEASQEHEKTDSY